MVEVRVLFENPENNYNTNVNGSYTNEQIKTFFIGKQLGKLKQVCTGIEIKRDCILTLKR